MTYIYTMSVLTIRVKPQIKEKMKKYDIKWSKEIRFYIEQRLAEEERRRTLMKISQDLNKIPRTEKGFSVKSVREDRDR